MEGPARLSTLQGRGLGGKPPRPCTWGRRCKPSQALSRWHGASRGPNHGGCTHRGVSTCVQVAGPPTPKKGWRARWGSDHSAQMGQAARGRKEAGGAARAPPSACPRPQSQWSPRPRPRLLSWISVSVGWGFSPLRCPRGSRARALGLSRPGPKGPQPPSASALPLAGLCAVGLQSRPGPALL